MNINEVLQGLNNLGGEMPRVTKAKRIKEIKPGKKNSNIKARKGPMNIDLSKLGEADDEGMYNNPELRRAAKRDQAINKEFAIGNFYAWAMEKYPNITLGQVKQKFPSLQREYSQEKTMRRQEPNKVPTVSSAFDNEKERNQAKGIKAKTSFESLEESVGQPITESEFDRLAEKKDACYHKVKSRYKVWPSAYASGALVQCRKKGAKNWGNKS